MLMGKWLFTSDLVSSREYLDHKKDFHTKTGMENIQKDIFGFKTLEKRKKKIITQWYLSAMKFQIQIKKRI